MAMGKKSQKQQRLWIETQALTKGPGHPFYEALNRVLATHGFDAFVEDECRPFYADGIGRPSLAPGIYFRLLLVGYFEGIDSERGIAWRLADSMTLREFLGYELAERTPDHSTISRNRRLLPSEVHQEVFAWILTLLGKEGLLRGKSLGVDATTLEANAALRTIVRRDSGEGYREFLTRLAQASGIETPTREQLARLDRKRRRKGSNDDWTHPHDPDARITKMKDGRTHLAHKAEHAVDLDTGAVLGVTVQPADRGDTTSLERTVDEAFDNLAVVVCEPIARRQMSETVMAELVADRGYHSGAVLIAQQEKGICTYIPEPRRGRRRWRGRRAERDATYANRRRVRGRRGRRLNRLRGELVERSFAHAYETGRMRRTHLRGHDNILKRLLVHVCGFNLSLVMRRRLGRGTPRGLAAAAAALVAILAPLLSLWRLLRRTRDHESLPSTCLRRSPLAA